MERLRPLAIVALLAFPLAELALPLASGAFETSLADQDIWIQISAPITGSNSGAQASDGLALTAGQIYYLYVGTNAAFGQTVNVGSGSPGSTDLFVVNQNGLLAPGGKGADAVLVSMTNTSQTYNPYYVVVRVTPSSTALYYLATNSGGFGSPGSLSYGWTFPPGDTTTHTGILGYTGAWHHSGSPTLEIAFAIKAGQQPLSEAGALNEISKTVSNTWDDSKATWTRVNPARYQLDITTQQNQRCGSTGALTCEFYQSFLPDTSLGGYLERATYYLNTARSGGSGSMIVALFVGTSAPTLPIDLTQARAEVDFNYNQQIGCGCAASARYIANWSAGNMSNSDVGGVTSVGITGVVWKEFGVTTTTPKAPSVALNPSTQLAYLYVKYTLANDGTYTSSGLGLRTDNPVGSGAACVASGTTWSCTSNEDFGYFQIGLYGGASVTQYSLAANPQTHGGAVWAYVREKLLASNPQLYTFSSSFGGKAKAGGFQFANATHVIQEWRLGYIASPWTTTQTLTLDVNTTGSLNNIVEVATFVTQSNTAHWHALQLSGGSAGFPAVELLSTDDYYTSVSFQVKECLDDSCGTQGNVVNTSAYLVTICSGVFGRTLSGSVDANASFNVTGQDIPGCTMSITLTASGYAATPWTIMIQAAGSYAYTLGIFKSGTITVKPSLGAVSLTFDGNSTRTIPDRVQINITRSRSATVFVGASHIDPGTGVVQHNVVRATVWDTSTSNTFNFYYPARTKSGAQDRGAYVVWVINDTGVVLGYFKFFLEPAGASWSQDDFTVTSDLISGISQNGYTSAQQAYQQAYQASILVQQKTVRDQIYEDFQNVHNYGIVFVLLLGVLAVIRAIRK